MYNKVFHDMLKDEMEKYGLDKNELRGLALVWKWDLKSLSSVRLFATPWIVACRL